MAVQVGLALVLLAGASLLVRSLGNLRRQDPGSTAANVLTAQLSFTPSLEGIQRLNGLASPLATRLASMPGVRAAAVSNFPIISRGYQSETVSLPGRPAREGERIHFNHVTAGFFETYGIPVLRGRPLEATDAASTPKVAVINERLARQYFGGEDPLGKLVSLAPAFDPQKAWQVVGVVRSSKYHDLRQEMPPQMYVPISQSHGVGLFVDVRAILGATPGAIQISVLRDALRPALVGVLTGLALALLAARVIRGLLYGIEPGDPVTLMVTAATVLGVALAGAWLPARAAARIDPMAALRSE